MSMPLYRDASEHAMAGGEIDMAAVTGMALWTSPIETKCTGMIYGT